MHAFQFVMRIIATTLQNHRVTCYFCCQTWNGHIRWEWNCPLDWTKKYYAMLEFVEQSNCHEEQWILFTKISALLKYKRKMRYMNFIFLRFNLILFSTVSLLSFVVFVSLVIFLIPSRKCSKFLSCFSHLLSAKFSIFPIENLPVLIIIKIPSSPYFTILLFNIKPQTQIWNTNSDSLHHSSSPAPHWHTHTLWK